MSTDHRDHGLKLAIKAAGGFAHLARMASSTRQAVHQWRRVPPSRVRIVSAMTGIPDYIIRPDLYVAPPRVSHDEVFAGQSGAIQQQEA